MCTFERLNCNINVNNLTMNLLQFICNFTLLIALVSAVAEKCNNDKCKIENNCKCTSNKSPIENAKTPKVSKLLPFQSKLFELNSSI